MTGILPLGNSYIQYLKPEAVVGPIFYNIPSYGTPDLLAETNKVGISRVYADAIARDWLDKGIGAEICDSLKSNPDLRGVLVDNLGATGLDACCMKNDDGSYSLYIIGSQSRISYMEKNGFAILRSTKNPLKRVRQKAAAGDPAAYNILACLNDTKHLKNLTVSGVFLPAEPYIGGALRDKRSQGPLVLNDKFAALMEEKNFKLYLQLAKQLQEKPLIVQTYFSALAADQIYGGFFGETVPDNITLMSIVNAALSASEAHPNAIRIAFPFNSEKTKFSHYKNAIEASKMELIKRALMSDEKPESRVWFFGNETLEQLIELASRNGVPLPYAADIKIGVTINDPAKPIDYTGLNKADFAVLSIARLEDADMAMNQASIFMKWGSEVFLSMDEEAARDLGKMRLKENGIENLILAPSVIRELRGKDEGTGTV